MNHFPFTLLFTSILFRLVLSLSPAYLACQFLKSAEESALTGCPSGTLYISQTDPSANFSSIQDAINSLPRMGKHAVILIGEGQYFERLTISRAAPLTLLGQLDPATASIRAGNASQRNLVRIWNNQYVKSGITEEETATLTVAPAVGFSFGNVDFKAYNLNFENLAANYAIAPALVTSVVMANASFYGCTFASWQDTWYTGFDANTYVVDSIIYGQVDYIFGYGRAWFQSVTLANRGCGGGITAWAGTPGTTNGAYIANSHIIRSPDVSETSVTNGSCFLGRPWNAYARTVYLHNYMDDSIHPAGFIPWSGTDGTWTSTIDYAEFGSYGSYFTILCDGAKYAIGSGGNMTYRCKVDRILGPELERIYTLNNVFGSPKWIDHKYQV